MQFQKYLLWLLFFSPLLVAAQKRYTISYACKDNSAAIKDLKKAFTDQQSAKKYIDGIQASLAAKGFIAASVDSVRYDSTAGFVWIYAGEKYAWGSVSFDTTAEKWWQKMGAAKGNLLVKNAITPDSLQQKMLTFLGNNGFPFASVGWDSVTISEGKIAGTLVLTEGPPYKIDSIIQKGPLKLKPTFLYRYLQIAPGMPYSQLAYANADSRLDELLFAERQEPSAIQMLGNGSLLNVYLKPRRSNVFNVLIGVMPASTQTPGSKLLITGDANILLRNVFGGGETIGANWQQIQYKSPRLNLLYQQPYLFASNAGIDFQFDLFKKDTQFLNIQMRIGVPYQFDTRQTGKVFYQLQQNTVAYVDTNAVKQNKQLPDLGDFSTSSLGLEWDLNTTDFKFNPRRGSQANLVTTAGLKKIKKNNEVSNLKDPGSPPFDYNSLYDTVKLKTYQLRFKGQFSQYFPLGRQSVFKAGVQGGWLQSANYFRNELFQIGGYRLLRGFDEESIYARNYLVGTVEYRYLTAKTGYLYAFADGGYAGYEDELQTFNHTYFGTGLGINFETKNSQVNLSWAVGKRNDLPFDLRQSKIHIGFVNFF